MTRVVHGPKIRSFVLTCYFIYITLLVRNVAVKLCAQAEGYFRDDPPFSHPSQHVQPEFS